MEAKCFNNQKIHKNTNAGKLPLVKKTQLEAKDVLPNINRVQVAESAKNAVFVPGDLDL